MKHKNNYEITNLKYNFYNGRSNEENEKVNAHYQYNIYNC